MKKYKLVILAIHSKMSGLPDKLMPHMFDFEWESHALRRAEKWLKYCPDDIVMLVEEN